MVAPALHVVVFHCDERDGPGRLGEGNSAVRAADEAPHRCFKKLDLG